MVIFPWFSETAKLKSIVFDCENLSALEILQQFNRNLSVLAPKEDLTSSVKTKSEKKSTIKRR